MKKPRAFLRRAHGTVPVTHFRLQRSAIPRKLHHDATTCPSTPAGSRTSAYWDRLPHSF